MSEGAVWWVQSAGRAWGPYPEARLAEFAREGRMTATSLVGRFEAGPFAPAAREPALARLFATGAPDAAASTSAPAPVAVQSAVAAAVQTGGALRRMLVAASLRQTSAASFEVELARHGRAVRCGAALWLVSGPGSPAALRNALSRGLGADESLMVVEAPLSAAAWFNLPGEVDRAVRTLWSGGEG